MSKQVISIRIDHAVLNWFREHHSKGYQTAINDVLAEHVRINIKEENFKLGRAQEIFRQYYSSCFWHLRPDLRITAEHLPLLRDGLRKNGGRRGYILADELN